ncbi:MAG: YraN family protein [Bacillota bacterium]|nr:YraN family protein [Bacillota bacterium]
MSFYRKKLGEKGERAAEKALKKEGYRLLERNYSVRGGEIDLIMERSGEILFVEVKTRTSEEFGTPLESIGSRKREHLCHAAKVYLSRRSLEDAAVSFCAVSVTADTKGKMKSVEIIKDIFL